MTDLNETIIELDKEDIITEKVDIAKDFEDTNEANKDNFDDPKCNLCNKILPNSGQAQKLHMSREHHMKTLQTTPGPTGSRTSWFKCDQCNIRRKSLSDLNHHMDSVHKKDPEGQQRTTKALKCTSCKYSCQSRPTMKKDMIDDKS